MIPLPHQASAHGLEAKTQQHELLSVWARTTSEFVLENRPASLTALVAHVRENLQYIGFADKNTIIRVCGAFTEALDNALYHGNLELSSDLRRGDHSEWHSAVAERMQRSPFKDRRIFVSVNITRAEIGIAIRDEGLGFDYTKLPDPTAPEYLERSTGRGVFLVRNLMDEVHFNESGNQITLIKRSPTRVFSTF
ncbi:MAG: hypothetical protein JWM11_6866 [Planctomycetaceae bacterium]|nr:hypothetical protein [Planctomycetaceae bacterium]